MGNNDIVNLEDEPNDNLNLKDSSENLALSSIQVIILGIAIGFIKAVFFQNLEGTLGTMIDVVAIILIIVGIFRIFKEGL